jgi:hypothetical protein
MEAGNIGILGKIPPPPIRFVDIPEEIFKSQRTFDVISRFRLPPNFLQSLPCKQTETDTQNDIKANKKKLFIL